MKAPLVALAILLLAVACARAADADPPAPAGRQSEPHIQRLVIEDKGARIDELRVRGQTQSITVTPKGAIRQPYEIIPADGGRDLSPNAQATRGAAGQRVWNVFSF